MAASGYEQGVARLAVLVASLLACVFSRLYQTSFLGFLVRTSRPRGDKPLAVHAGFYSGLVGSSRQTWQSQP